MKKVFCLTLFFILISSLSSYAQTEQEYLVKLKEGAEYSSDTKMILEPVAKEWDIYKVSGENVTELDMSDVECIEEDYAVELMDFVPNDEKYTYQSGFMNIINAPYSWNFNMLGRGVRVGIIDSGINENHPDLKNRIVKAVDYTESGNVSEDVAHGSSVAGVIAAEMNNAVGMAGVSQADIYMYKVFKGSSASVSDIVEAFSDAVNTDKCDVINMSLGVKNENLSSTTLNSLNILEYAIKSASQNGVIVVAAAGNYAIDGNPLVYPAAYEDVVSVAAVDSNETYANFSEYNNMVDVAAPGVNVYVTTPSGYGLISGTSISSPYVSAAAAIVKGINPSVNHEQFMNMIENSSKDVGDAGYDFHNGWGILNIEGLVKMAWNTTDALYPSVPDYKEDTSQVDVMYYNSGDTKKDNHHLRLALYDKDKKLVKLTDEVDTTFSPKVTDTYIFDGIKIPYGGSVKVFCMSDWSKLIPAASMTELIK